MLILPVVFSAVDNVFLKGVRLQSPRLTVTHVPDSSFEHVFEEASSAALAAIMKSERFNLVRSVHGGRS